MTFWFSAALHDAIAIDLGTANILAHQKGRGIVFNEPAVVAIMEEGTRQRVLAVGQEAKRMVGRTPGNIRAIRPLRDGVIGDFEVAEQLIGYVIRKVRPGYRLRRPMVAISVPSGATPVERRAIRQAAEASGAREALLIDEPMAAAIGAGLPVKTASGSMIVDIGGGTTELAVVALGGTVLSRSLRMAGHAMDASIAAHLRREHRLLVGEETAERIKLALGSAHPPEDGEGQTMPIRGRDMLQGVPIALMISEAEIARAVAEPVAAIVDLVRASLEHVPPEIASDIVENGITLTGGGSLLRGLDHVLHTSTRLPVRISPTALEDVALGVGQALENRSAYPFVFEAE